MQARSLANMKLLLVVIFCAVPLINAKSVKGRETSTCIADYLKSVGLIPADFGAASESSAPSQLCLSIVEVTKSQILQNFRLELLTDKDMKTHADCIIGGLKKSDFANNLLIVFVLQTFEGIDDKLQTEMSNLTETKVNRATFDAYLLCEANVKFGELFNGLVDGSSSEEEVDPKEDYCVRKHIKDNNLSYVDIPVNPKNVDTSNLDCTALYQKAIKEGEEELTKTLLEDDSSEEGYKITPSNASCLMDAVKKGNYFEKMLQFQYIKELNLDGTKKEEMRDKFVMIMTKLAEAASKCFL